MKQFRVLFLMLICFQANVYSAENVSYVSGGRRDPMVPIIDENGRLLQAADSAAVHVEGIIYDSKNGSIVVMNGESYKVGDSVGNYLLKAIHTDRIILERDGEQKMFFLNDPSSTEQKGHGTV